MLIGELAEQAGVPTQTVRFYERKGLLPRPTRGANGYRSYDSDTSARLHFIKVAQAAGLTLAEIRGVLDLRDEGTTPCGHVTTLIEDRLAEVTERIRQLGALQVELQGLLERSHRLDPADCSEADICQILTPRQ